VKRCRIKKKSLVDRAWQMQCDWEQKRKQRKTDKEQRYRAFLAFPPRPLPSFESLVRVRNLLAVSVFCIMSVSSIQVLFFLHTWFINPFHLIPMVCFVLATMVTGFFLMVDYVIFKRWGNTKSFMDW